jgi:hypothetical protein
MLKISRSQFEMFQSKALVAFDDEMLKHCAEFSPRLSAILGCNQLRVVVRSAIRRAAGHGFTFKGPVRLFIELCFLLGSGFDIDIQYPWASECLGEPDPHTQMRRAETLYPTFRRS